MNTLHHLATASPYLAAFVVLLVIAAIGVLIWAMLPERTPSDRYRDIDRQIQSLRRHADQDVQRRPRVRATSTPSTTPLKACGGGHCRQRVDCADTYCPGLQAAHQPGANRHASC